MIAYFPEIYPDELFYSVASRFYMGNGYLSCTQMIDNFYANGRTVPEYQFINAVKPDVLEHLCQNTTFEQFLQGHTMLRYYGRFMGTERRKEAYSALVNMSGDYGRIFPVGKGALHLKYCPLCVTEDRQLYGETYWHTIHQIPELRVCPVHGCRLIESNVVKSKSLSNNYIPAEMAIFDMGVASGCQREIDLAKYLYELIQCDFNLYDGAAVDEYLSCCFYGTKYSSSRGKSINVSILIDDLLKYYADFEIGIKKPYQIMKMLNGKRTNTFEIAQMGMFLGIEPGDLAKAELPEILPEQDFELKVVNLLNKGESIYNISRELKASQETIRAVVDKYGMKKKYSRTEEYLEKKRLADQKKIEEYRKLWLAAVQEYPGSSLTQILKDKKYMIPLKWLRIKDRRWTNEHYPK